jgi:hypothetical protein
MAYEEPGVKVILELAAAGVVVQSPTQALALVGPLYEVFEEELAAAKYDAATGAGVQAFVWPGKKTTSVVDLAGIRGDTAEPDDQLLEAADYPMVVKLRDPSTLVESTVNLVTNVSTVSQTGFSIDESASAATAKSSGSDVSSAEEGKFYKAAGGLVNLGLAIGDRIRLTNGTFDLLGAITAFTDTEVTYDTGVAAVADTVNLAVNDGNASIGSNQVSSAAGGFTAGAAVGDRLVVWKDLSQTDDSNGTTALTITTAGGHGLVPDVVAGDSVDVGRKITIHSANAADGATIISGTITTNGTTTVADSGSGFVAGDLGKMIRVSGGGGSLPNTYRRITDVSGVPGAVIVDTLIAASAGADADVLAPLVRTIDTIADANTLTYTGGDAADGSQVDISVTVHDPDYRDITVVNDDNTLTYSGLGLTSPTGNLFLFPLDVYSADLTYEIFPDYDVLVDFRALEVDQVDDTIALSAPSEVAALGDTGKYNPLLFAASQALTAMGTDDVQILLLPVDLFSDQISGSKSGLPEDSNEVQAYQLALEVMSSEESAYYLVPLTKNSSVRDNFETHCDANSIPAEKKERICYLSYDMPMGEFESTTGSIEPGEDGGNKRIKDAGQGFISTHGIIPGKVVTVVSPAAYAGDYVVGTGTDDDNLELEGANWTITPEMTVADGDFDASAGEVSTGVADAWKDADVGDWLVSGGLYRQITAKTSTTLLSYGGGALSGTGATVSIIRSAQLVDYFVDPLTKTEQAENLRDISIARSNFRVVHFWPDEVQYVTGTDNQGNDVEELVPGFYGAAAEAGRDSVMRPERSSTGEALAGPTGLVHSNKYFGRTLLNTIASGGWSILEQLASGGPVEMRHLMSTDVSTQKRLEVSATKNVDNMAKVMRLSLEPSLNDDEGRINITDSFLKALYVPVEGILNQFVDNDQLVVGPNGEEPYNIQEITADSDILDQINARVAMTIPIPGNRVEVTFAI